MRPGRRRTPALPACVRALERAGVLLLTLGLLGGCSTITSITSYWMPKDTAEPPAPLVQFKPSIKVDTLWSHDVGSGSRADYVKLTPAVIGDRVFAADEDGGVSAYAAQNGNRVWHTDTQVPISGGPGVGDGMVLVGSSNGDVVALSADDGHILWKARVSSEVLSAPQAGDGIVVVRTSDGKLFGLAAKDGSRAWVYERSVPLLSLRGTSAPVITGNAVVAGFDSGVLVAVGLKSGQVLWETRIAVPTGRSDLQRMVDIDATPVVTDNTVYVVTYHGRIAAVDLQSGNVLWRRDMSSYSGLAVGLTNVYVSDAQGHVWALDRFTGASLWRQKKLEARQLSGPAILGDYVVVGDLEGYVHWMRRQDGQFVARVRVGESPIRVAPVASQGVLYVYGSGGVLAALKVH